MKSNRWEKVGGLGRILPAGLLGWLLVGCDAPPDIRPMAPPGAPILPKTPDEEPAEAQGEMAAPALAAATAKPEAGKVVEYTPAPPTAKGETRTTPGGVKYETLKEGTGPELKAGQVGQFHYEGRLADGKVVEDRSRKSNSRPADLELGEKLTGWREALPGMRVGEVRQLTVPPELAFGKDGKPPEIPPNATITYEVELVRILGQ
jgi:FKBP-type peptidyl-prolyl cis-trans isomerase FkpA